MLCNCNWQKRGVNIIGFSFCITEFSSEVLTWTKKTITLKNWEGSVIVCQQLLMYQYVCMNLSSNHNLPFCCNMQKKVVAITSIFLCSMLQSNIQPNDFRLNNFAIFWYVGLPVKHLLDFFFVLQIYYFILL